jgi:hypothetical protein
MLLEAVLACAGVTLRRSPRRWAWSELDTDADVASLVRLAASTERYCVVGQSLRTPP